MVVGIDGDFAGEAGAQDELWSSCEEVSEKCCGCLGVKAVLGELNEVVDGVVCGFDCIVECSVWCTDCLCIIVML